MSEDSPTKPPDSLAKTDDSQSLIGQSYHYSGPIPHPALLNQYDPKTRKIIVAMAAKQSYHRQSIEASVIASNIWNERAGMLIAAFLTVLMLGSGMYLLMHDKDAVGFLLIFGPSLFHAGNYIYNKRQEQETREKQPSPDEPDEPED